MPNNLRRPRRNYDKLPQNKSGIQYFYQSLIGWGVHLTVDAGRIVIHAPAGNVSPALEKEVRKREQALLAHLRTIEQAHDATLGKVLDNAKELGF